MSSESRNPVFGVNDYNKPKIQTPKESIINDILMILLGKPGFYPSIPSLGMDVSQYLYKFEDEVSTDSIKADLAYQCSEFSDEIQSGEIDVVLTEYKGHSMLLFILPVINDSKKNQLAIAVTTNDNGEIVYNFIENTTQII